MANSTIRMEESCAVFQHPATKILFNYWQSLRNTNQSLPCQEDFNLRDIKSLVPNLLILERGHSFKSLYWRLAGSEICTIYREEKTGKDFLESWPDLEKQSLYRFFSDVVSKTRCGLMTLSLTSNYGHNIRLELIAFPIRARQNGASHIFGGAFMLQDTASPKYSRIILQRILQIELLEEKSIFKGSRENPRKLSLIIGGKN